MENTAAGQQSHKSQKARSSHESIKRLNLWVPEKIYRSLLQEASSRGITITACAGLKLAGDVSAAGAVREAEVLNRQVVDLRKQMNQLENEKRSYSDLRTLYNQSLRVISALQNQKDDLLKQKAGLEKANRKWQDHAAEEEASQKQVDQMITRFRVLESGGTLNEETRRILTFIMLGRPLN